MMRTKEETLAWIENQMPHDARLVTDPHEEDIAIRWKSGTFISLKEEIMVSCDYHGNHRDYITFINDCIPVIEFVLKLNRYLNGEDES